MATNVKNAKNPTVVTKSASNGKRTAEPMDEMAQLKADRAALDAKIKQASAAQRAEKAAARVAVTHKSLETVIAAQEAEPIVLWMGSNLVGRVAQRTRAGQDREAAIADVTNGFAQFIREELDRRASARSAKGGAAE
jgi:hypothetical protein